MKQLPILGVRTGRDAVYLKTLQANYRFDHEFVSQCRDLSHLDSESLCKHFEEIC